MVYDVHNWEQLQWVAKQHHVVILDFYAQWCGPCKQVAPQLPGMEAAFNGSVGIAKIDVDQAPDLMAHYGVQAMPTFVVVFAGGRHEAGRVQGANVQEVMHHAHRAVQHVTAHYQKHEAQRKQQLHEYQLKKAAYEKHKAAHASQQRTHTAAHASHQRSVQSAHASQSRCQQQQHHHHHSQRSHHSSVEAVAPKPVAAAAPKKRWVCDGDRCYLA